MLLVFIVAATICSARSQARAALETMSITLASQGPSGDGSGSPQVTLYNTDGSVATQAYVSQGGAVDWSNLTYLSGDHYTFAGDPLNPASNSTFISFCIELTQDISLNSTYTVDVVSLASAPKPASGPLATGMGSTPAMLIAELWAAHFHDIFYTGSQQNPLEPTQEESAAAFQLAVWKLEYDSNNLSNYSGNALFQHGFLQVTQNIGNASVGLAANWIADVVKMNGKGPQANLLAISGHPTGLDANGNPIYPDFQDQVVEVLPEPSSMVLWAMGALGMAAIRRGRRRGR